MTTNQDEDWRTAAACRGLAQESGSFDLFFDEAHERQAKRVCAECDVRLECLRWSIQSHEWEPWVVGGLNLKERDRIYRSFLRRSRYGERTDAAWRAWIEREAG